MEIERTVLSHSHYVVDNPRRLTAAHYADYALYLSPGSDLLLLFMRATTDTQTLHCLLDRF